MDGSIDAMDGLIDAMDGFVICVGSESERKSGELE